MKILLFVLTLLLFSFVDKADAACINAFNSTSDFTQGNLRDYAGPWDQWDKRLMVRGTNCGDNDTTTTLQVGTGDMNDYIYKNAYYWDGEQWVLIPLTGDTLEGVWYRGQATSQSPVPVNDVNNTYFATFTCKKVTQ